MAVVIMVVAMVAEAMAVVIMVVAMVAEAMVVVIMAEAIPNPIPLTLIDLLARMVGKTEVMETLLKTLNMKVVEVGEKGEYLM